SRSSDRRLYSSQTLRVPAGTEMCSMWCGCCLRGRRAIIHSVGSIPWVPVFERKFQDVKYEHFEGIARITINRPEVRNAFRPETVFELLEALEDAHEDPDIGVVLLTGAGDKAFCSGGDQTVRGHGGYVGKDRVP